MRTAAVLAACFALLAVSARATETERLYLSGSGDGTAVSWEFRCNEGRGCGEWTTIPVPSQWELQGFGAYNYGHDKRKSEEEGFYRHRFEVPADWRGRHVELVFDGVMTDTAVRLNGQPAGDVHQGAFYRFRIGVTDLLDFEGPNLLEVTVAKQSANESVNRAEREADYWVFGGIFRPVWLEATPSEAIRTVAVDARHDGRLRVVVELRGVEGDAELTARLTGPHGTPVGQILTAVASGSRVELSGEFRGVLPWSAEDPHLYNLDLELRRDGRTLHRHRERIGFRTVELRPEGLFVNGRRTLLKGTNRHAFWPSSGRTLDRELDRRDAELMKAMNLNAVRASHYPPDESFLDACDELGLYVVDELAGWHDAYDTEVGTRLVREMVVRDRNHPSILFWANGNEGGWNEDLDALFAVDDLQDRPVIHPDAGVEIGGVALNTAHYPSWDELEEALAGPSLYLPTEFNHGLYDGGAGASLDDTWRAMRASPRALGGFLWAFTDESVVRTDQDGRLDSDGNHAPDGILGPYRELSGSFYAVREVFSPVEVAAADLEAGVVTLVNRFDATPLEACRVRWTWLTLPRPTDPEPVLAELSYGEQPAPPAPPGGRATLALSPPDAAASALRLAVVDPAGREVRSVVLPRQPRRISARRMVEEGSGTVEARRDGDVLVLAAGGVEARFDPASGRLLELVRGGRRLGLDGPRPLAGKAAPAAAFDHRPEGGGHVVEARWTAGEVERVRYQLFPSGWLRLSVLYRAEGRRDVVGVGFPFMPALSFEWLGRGPARIWKNRRQGGTLGLWRKTKADETPVEAAHEPKLAGFYGGVRWARLGTAEGVLAVVVEGELDLGVGVPRFPDDARGARAAVPEAGLVLAHEIPAIGTKFHDADELGPAGRGASGEGLYGAAVWLIPTEDRGGD